MATKLNKLMTYLYGLVIIFLLEIWEDMRKAVKPLSKFRSVFELSMVEFGEVPQVTTTS